MKKKFFTKFLMVIAMLFGLVVTGGNLAVNADSTTVTTKVSDYASAHNWSDATKYTSLAMDDYITITVSGGGNTGKYYKNGYNWRMYQNENPKITVNAAGGRTLTSIKFTYSASNNGCMTYNNSKISSATVVDVSGLSSATFGVGNTGTATNGQARITEIQVVYDSPSVSEHTCVFDQEKVDDKYKVSDADCENAAVYCKSCTCGVKGTETFESGEALGHNYSNLGICERCDALEESALSSLKLVLAKYYNKNQYLKETVLNTTDMTLDEVKKYFHASASVKERETWYYGDAENGTTKLTMITNEYNNKEDKVEVVTSTYENKDRKVYHTGKGGDWYVNWPSVENQFVTLKDFIDSEDENWTYAEGIYTYELEATTATSEHKMTKMAREFVAPMWLAPNASNYEYVTFTKLTIEEKDSKGLVMKLYVDPKEEEGKVTDANGIFAQATINKVYNLTINTDANCEVVDEVSVIAANHTNTFTVNVTNGYQLTAPVAEKAKAILTGENGVQVSNVTGNATITLTTEVETAEKEVTLSFADKANRTVYTTTQQVWVQGDVTLTNNKAASTSNVGDYANPVRLYANSEVIITVKNMTKIVFVCNSSSHATALKNSIGTVSGTTVSVSSSTVTVTFGNAVNEFVVKKLTAQVQLKSLTATYTK